MATHHLAGDTVLPHSEHPHVDWPYRRSVAKRYGVAVLAVVVALLMVSNVAYPHLTKQMLRGKRRRPMALVPFALVAGIILQEAALVVLFWSYAVSFAARGIWIRVMPREPDAEFERRK